MLDITNNEKKTGLGQVRISGAHCSQEENWTKLRTWCLGSERLCLFKFTSQLLSIRATKKGRKKCGCERRGAIVAILEEVDPE